MPETPVIAPLPSLREYRAELIASGVPDPLPFVPVDAAGLLARLPAPTDPTSQGWPWDVETPPAPSGESTSWPEIFIAMPSFRQGAYIEAALRSILLQNYPRLRVVVADADSPDETAAILARYQPWLSYVRRAPDRGQAHALNLCFSLASNTAIHGWLNSDDLLLPGALQAIAHTWSQSRADFIYGDGLTLDAEQGPLSLDQAGWVHPAFRRYPGIVFSHAAFWAGHHLQPFREQLFGAIDYEFWIRLLPHTRRRRHVSQPLGLIRVHPAAKSHDPALRARWARDAQLNGLAYPELYRAGPQRRWLHHVTQRLVRRLRRANALAGARAICTAACWPAVITRVPPR